MLVRANALESNFRLYSTRDGQRRMIASARVTDPTLGEWHSIRAVAKGAKVQAYLDGPAAGLEARPSSSRNA